ncbi:PqqD family protein [Peribacillus asahii]|uniref:PqqD family protein n=1 Tax=Peribacillus asahii TaxID=228899 RepID=UPI0037F27A88
MFHKRQSEKRNLLTMVPLLKESVSLERDNVKGSYLIIQRTNTLERFSIRFFKQPAVRRIKLDQFGVFVIQQIEQRKNVHDISEAMIAHFGEAAEPALPRLAKFLEILEVQNWITWESQ